MGEKGEGKGIYRLSQDHYITSQNQMSISQDIQYLIDKLQDYRKVPAFNGSETRNPGLLRGDRLQ